jgi:hypothetical protein
MNIFLCLMSRQDRAKCNWIYVQLQWRPHQVRRTPYPNHDVAATDRVSQGVGRRLAKQAILLIALRL